MLKLHDSNIIVPLLLPALLVASFSAFQRCLNFKSPCMGLQKMLRKVWSFANTITGHAGGRYTQRAFMLPSLLYVDATCSR